MKQVPRTAAVGASEPPDRLQGFGEKSRHRALVTHAVWNRVHFGDPGAVEQVVDVPAPAFRRTEMASDPLFEAVERRTDITVPAPTEGDRAEPSIGRLRPSPASDTVRSARGKGGRRLAYQRLPFTPPVSSPVSSPRLFSSLLNSLSSHSSTVDRSVSTDCSGVCSGSLFFCIRLRASSII